MGEWRSKKIFVSFLFSFSFLLFFCCCCCFLRSFSLPRTQGSWQDFNPEWMDGGEDPSYCCNHQFWNGSRQSKRQVCKAVLCTTRAWNLSSGKRKPRSLCYLIHLTKMPDEHLLNPTKTELEVFFILEAAKTNLEGFCREIKNKAPELLFASHHQSQENGRNACFLPHPSGFQKEPSQCNHSCPFHFT